MTHGATRRFFGLGVFCFKFKQDTLGTDIAVVDVYVYKEVDVDINELERKVGELEMKLGEGFWTHSRATGLINTRDQLV